jgi:hypothetical protein
VFCVGAAVYDRSGGCVAAVSGTGLKLNRPTWRMDELGIAIRDAADQVTAALGGPPFATRQAARVNWIQGNRVGGDAHG